MTVQANSNSGEWCGQPAAQSVRHVLLVDDSELERRIVASLLRKWGFDVTEASDAKIALELCRNQLPDLVLSDWMMPGMTGPEFCEKFRELSADMYGYFILLTSKRTSIEVAHGLNAGADDFLIKPVNPQELRARIVAGDRILKMQRELSEKNRVVRETLTQLQDVYDKIDADLIQAQKIQKSLVPRLQQNFGANRISLLLKPCGHIGGDLVGMFQPGRNRIGFYSIDVSGHGITSAMMTARLGSYLSSSHMEQNVAVERRFEKFYALRQPKEVAAHLNSRLNADTGIEEYFTMVYAIADLRMGHVKMVQAGHPPPLLMRRDGQFEFLGDGGMPIGLLPDIDFQQSEFRMAPGDRLLLYSDGLTECQMKDGNMLEEHGLLDLVRTVDAINGQEFLDDLYRQLTHNMHPENGAADDVSATLFEYQGPEPDS